MRKSTPDDFWGRVIKADGCWLWRGAHFRSGYARVKYRGKDTVAHRISWKLTYGDVKNGLELDHLCRNRWCVNPVHLEPVTHRENEIRGHTFIRDNFLKTHCHKGHPLSGENLFVRKGGRRRCKACERNTQKDLRSTDEYRARHAAYERKRREFKRSEL